MIIFFGVNCIDIGTIDRLPNTTLIYSTIALTWFTSKCSIELNEVRCWTIHPKTDIVLNINTEITETMLPELWR